MDQHQSKVSIDGKVAIRNVAVNVSEIPCDQETTWRRSKDFGSKFFQ
jgi:hypothetical protein